MNFNDYFNKQYLCDFNQESRQEEPFTIERLRIARGTLQHKKQEQELYDLFEFIRMWRDSYDMFCHSFNCYTYANSRVFDQVSYPVEYGDVLVPKQESYLAGFFDIIINKSAKFEIQQYKQAYDSVYGFDGKYQYTKIPDQNVIISGSKFTIFGKENKYRLDIKMNAALVCSLLVAISNNYIIYNWYSKQSRFKKFIDKMASSHYFIEFQIDSRNTKVLISGSQNDPSLRIDIEDKWLYFILPNETLRVENQLHYNHLDDLFGKDRKEPLTTEDIQLYSICNEGRKPTMYDFEF